MQKLVILQVQRNETYLNCVHIIPTFGGINIIACNGWELVFYDPKGECNKADGVSDFNKSKLKIEAKNKIILKSLHKGPIL